jgi:hypothetical protein
MTGVEHVKAWSDAPIDFMSAPLVQWLAGLTGWDPFWAAVAIGVPLLWFFIFAIVQAFTLPAFLIRKANSSTGLAKFGWYSLAVVVTLVLIVLDILITVILALMVIAFLNGLINAISNGGSK